MKAKSRLQRAFEQLAVPQGDLLLNSDLQPLEGLDSLIFALTDLPSCGCECPGLSHLWLPTPLFAAGYSHVPTYAMLEKRWRPHRALGRVPTSSGASLRSQAVTASINLLHFFIGTQERTSNALGRWLKVSKRVRDSEKTSPKRGNWDGYQGRS